MLCEYQRGSWNRNERWDVTMRTESKIKPDLISIEWNWFLGYDECTVIMNYVNTGKYSYNYM